MLDPDILTQLDRFDPCVSKPANIKRYIQREFGKEISYAQLAYEMSKRKHKILSKTIGITVELKEDTQIDDIKQESSKSLQESQTCIDLKDSVIKDIVNHAVNVVDQMVRDTTMAEEMHVKAENAVVETLITKEDIKEDA